MTAPRSDDVHRNTGVEQQGLMGTSEVMEPERRETELVRPARELVREAARVPRLGLAKGNSKQPDALKLEVFTIHAFTLIVYFIVNISVACAFSAKAHEHGCATCGRSVF